MTLKPWRMDMGFVMRLKTSYLGWWFSFPQTPSLGSHLSVFDQDCTPRVAYTLVQSKCLINIF